ncbi:MAG: type I DNA topoisomerase [Paracoccaceae bacterium]|nr:type I DNA topoisomerase [Paracoccaceae bacterium]
MPVVVVESPAKAKTIEKYLGKGFRVLASYGHVRDLKEKSGSVDPERGFAMTWEIDKASAPRLRAIAEALKGDRNLILATDPDREGEAISWHVQEALRQRKAIGRDAVIRRVAFNAVTKDAVNAAFNEPREIDSHLVEAYLARRALDYLVGFELSPVLWKKLPGARSAGRVQSVALRLVVERELEILTFDPREHWTVAATLATPGGESFEAQLTHVDGQKLGKFDLANQEAADTAAQAVRESELSVGTVESKPVLRNPPPPLITSTLQQEASRRFRFAPRRSMSAAQKLYEAGHITYMRTDSVHMEADAVAEARRVVLEDFGTRYLPKTPRKYRTRSANAQEAHECIRPTNLAASPNRFRSLPPDEARIYLLVWQRALASQMSSARFERTTVDVRSADDQLGLRATGQVLIFDGFLRLHEEGKDNGDVQTSQGAQPDSAAEPGEAGKDMGPVADPGDGDPPVRNQRLPKVKAGDRLGIRAVEPKQHWTQPPPRFTEASLIKRMVELGVGRPSTYATIVSTIQERNYVRNEKNRLIPEDVGILVTTFLKEHFRKYVNYDYTAGLEQQLDAISSGRLAYRDVLGDFWTDFSGSIVSAGNLEFNDVFRGISDALAPILFPPSTIGARPRQCPECNKGELSVRTARQNGTPFIGCSNYPECRFTRPFGKPPGSHGEDAAPGTNDPAGARLLGTDSEGNPITVRTGPYGHYVQKGEAVRGSAKPPRASIPKGMDAAGLDLETALGLLSLPRHVGQHPDGGEIKSGIGRHGPYVVLVREPGGGGTKPTRIYANLDSPHEALIVGENRAIALLAEKQKATSERGPGRRGRPEPLRVLGDHPSGHGVVEVMPGRYGPYVKHGNVNATLPRDADPATVTLDEAVDLIAAKAAAGGSRKRRRRPG